MRVLITGITGQDGSYMAEFLLEKGHEVYGLVRRSSLEKYDRIESIVDRIKFVEGDLTDQGSLDAAMDQIQPHEVYNLAAQSFVPVSWNQPVLTADVTGLGVLRMLEAIRKHCPTAKYLQASSSEMFGKVLEKPQTEKTPFHPRSPYGVAKVFGHHITVNCLLFHLLQPRVSPARGRICNSKGHPTCGADQTGIGGPAQDGQPGCAKRLGIRGRLRCRHVAHAAAAPTG